MIVSKCCVVANRAVLTNTKVTYANVRMDGTVED